MIPLATYKSRQTPGFDTKEVSDTLRYLVSESQEADLIENVIHRYRMLQVRNTTIGLAM